MSSAPVEKRDDIPGAPRVPDVAPVSLGLPVVMVIVVGVSFILVAGIWLQQRLGNGPSAQAPTTHTLTLDIGRCPLPVAGQALSIKLYPPDDAQQMPVRCRTELALDTRAADGAKAGPR